MHSIDVHKDKLIRLLKYGAVGAVSFITEYGVFSLLLAVTDFGTAGVLVAQTISYVIALLVNFIGTSRFTFSSNRDGFNKSTAQQVRTFMSLALFNLLVSNIVIYLLTHPLQLHPLPAKLLVMAMVITWNYLIFSKYIFAAKK